MPLTWKPRLVNTPMPIMSATAMAAAVTVDTVRNSIGRSPAEGAPSVLAIAIGEPARWGVRAFVEAK